MLVNLRKRMRCQKGFTLIELMVVIAIIGVLATIAVPRYSSASATAHGAKVQADLSSIDTAIQMAIAQGHAVGEAASVASDPSVKANMNSIPTPDCESFRIGTVDYTGVAAGATYQIIMDGYLPASKDASGKPIPAVTGSPRAAIAATAGAGATNTKGPFTADKLGK